MMNRRKFLSTAGAVFVAEGLFPVSAQSRALPGISKEVIASLDDSSRLVAFTVTKWGDNEETQRAGNANALAEVAAVEVLHNCLSGKCCWADLDARAERRRTKSFFPKLLDFIGESPLIVSDYARTVRRFRRELKSHGFSAACFPDNAVIDVDRFRNPDGPYSEAVEFANSLPRPCFRIDKGCIVGNMALVGAEWCGNIFVAARKFGLAE